MAYAINWYFVIKDNETGKTYSFLVNAPNERIAIRFMRESLEINNISKHHTITKFNRVEENKVVLIDNT